MKSTQRVALIALTLAATGCGTLFSARAELTPTRAQAQLRVDGRVAAAAGVAAGIVSALEEGGAADSQPAVAAGVHGPDGVGPTATPVATAAAPVGVAPAAPGAPSSTEAAAPRVALGRVVGVTVQRVVVGTSSDVLAGGALVLDGAPDVAGGISIVDGSIACAPAAAGSHVAQWRVTGGTLLVAARDGHRWRLRVRDGSVGARTDGPNVEGHTIWSPASGALRVDLSAMGDERLALTGDAPSLVVGSSAGAPLDARALGALDALLRAAPAGSEESLRLAEAVQVAVRDNASTTPAFFAVPVRGRSLVLVVDVSYSMREPDPRAIDRSIATALTPTKLDVARAELVKVLGSLPADETVDVVAFSSNVTRLWPAPRTLDAASLDEAIRWIAALRPRDETEPVAALEAAAAMQPEQIVLLSDGRPTEREPVERTLLGLADGVSSRIRLDVVGIGPDEDRPFLAALAERGRGELRLR